MHGLVERGTFSLTEVYALLLALFRSLFFFLFCSGYRSDSVFGLVVFIKVESEGEQNERIVSVVGFQRMRSVSLK